MTEKIQTAAFPLEGGQINNLDDLTLAATKPGAAIRMVNFEPSANGGYRRINGFETYISSVVPGSGKIKGVGVYNGGVIAARQYDVSDCRVYYGDGTSWTLVGASRSGLGVYRFHSYSLSAPCVIICDGTNLPSKWDGTTLTHLTGAPTGARLAMDHKNYMFFAKDQILTYSAPNDDTDYTAAAGAGDINVGDDIVALKAFRDQLIIFCKTRILRLDGDNSFNWVLSPITKNLGCVAGDTVQEIGGDLVYLSPDGLRPISASERIGDFEIESISRNIQGRMESVVPTYIGGDVHSVVVREKTQYRLLFGSASVASNETHGFIGAIRAGTQGVAWEWGELYGLQASCSANGYNGETELVVHGGYDGYVYQQERSNTFGGAPINEQLTLPYNNFGDPFFRKTMYKVKVYADFEGQSDLYLRLRYDFNSNKVVQPGEDLIRDGSEAIFTFGTTSQFGTAQFGARSEQDVTVNLVGSGKTVSLDFYSKTASNPYTIKALGLEYLPGARR